MDGSHCHYYEDLAPATWEVGINWDDQVPDDITATWTMWKLEIHNLSCCTTPGATFQKGVIRLSGNCTDFVMLPRRHTAE